MFLASMGRLKHKRTRNTIAAEETPRSSCPSEAGPTAAPAAESGILNTTEEHQTISGHNIEKEAVVKGVSAPVPHAGTRGATAAGRAPDWPGDNPGVKHVNSGNAAGDLSGFRTLAWSHPRPLSPTAKRHDQDADSHPRNHGITNGDGDLLPAKGPAEGNLGARAASSAAGAMFPSAEDVAAETRLMPVGAIHRAFEGRRLAAVQAWDPLAAAAVRAKRAEKMLRRAFLGRTGTNSVETMPAAAPARRRPRKAPGTKAAATTTTENKVGGGTSDRGGGVRGSRKCSSARRVGGPAERSVGRGRSESDSKSDADWCGSRGSRRDAKRGKESRELYRTEFARAVAAVERIGGRRIVHGAGALSKQAVGGAPAGANVLSTRKRDAVESVSRPSRGSIKTSKSRSASGSSRETSPMRTSRTARTSTATSRSSRCPSSRRGSSTCNSGRGTSVSGDDPVEMRRARLLAELEVLRRRMHDAEGLLREVDRSRPKQRRDSQTLDEDCLV
ncbi:unnamed protein product [Ectocarpus sp. 4 AP-2014]